MLVVAALLAAGVLGVVGNTIRLEIDGRRAEIEVTKLVGGSNAFVRRPFLYSGLCRASLGGLLAAGLVAAGLVALEPFVARLAAAYGSHFILRSLSIREWPLVVAGGAALGFLGAWLAAAYHLRPDRTSRITDLFLLVFSGSWIELPGLLALYYASANIGLRRYPHTMTGQALSIPEPVPVLTAPIGSLEAYVERVSAIPMLDREVELALARRFRDDQDLDAARDLVLSHLRFVVHIARGYLGYGLPLGDLVQEGNVGLMKAVKRFDPDMGVRLVCFAVHWIRAEIHEYVIRNWRLVRVATTKAQRKLFFNLRRMKKNLAWLSEEETQAVARELGVEPREVREMEQRLSARDLSFDPLPDAGDEDSIASPSLYLPAPEADPATTSSRTSGTATSRTACRARSTGSTSAAAR